MKSQLETTRHTLSNAKTRLAEQENVNQELEKHNMKLSQELGNLSINFQAESERGDSDCVVIMEEKMAQDELIKKYAKVCSENLKITERNDVLISDLVE